ncbi:magnesium/cobalt transporter CorA [Marinigracilibium pacificum]|uniref:Magnesium transport protein CorA n=1 Tax=Marinigracilibium pacificum TaxID=2729599 RepID=A0A848J2A6_9BACT|nr:magnesium/cobalt transporter CorA [Marinigracilibium pacificum]NMM49916.1 magnesium/cobalt transporter CorA [Marinigracilibium pacificum]
MKSKLFLRPDKLLFKGLQNITGIGQDFYTNQKSEAKAKAELTFIGKKKVQKVNSQIYTYSLENFNVNNELNDYSLLKEINSSENIWLNFHGLHEVSKIEKIGEVYGLERLVIRQILDTTQRPKIEIDDNYLFLNVKSPLKGENGEVLIEHMSFVMGDKYLISFQEEKSDHFGSIRNKIIEGVGYIRKRSIDYLLVQMLDAILDHYFITIDEMNKECSLLEKEILRKPSEETTLALENLKGVAQIIKKALGPLKEVLLNILNEETELIRRENVRYFKDLINTASSAIDEIDNTQKTLESLTNIYFASLSQKMNEIMKVLTTVATIFIPLTFVAGIYGMNFENMPELSYKNGYFIILGIMLFISILMVIYFKRKRWI